MVILDPLWNLQSLQTNAAGDLLKVLTSLPNKLVGMCETDTPNQPHPLAFLQPSIKHALVSIVKAVVGLNATLYVNDFLDEYVPQMRIPRDLDFE
jgi:hypothetical protein